jgi:hypothetical protein
MHVTKRASMAFRLWLLFSVSYRGSSVCRARLFITSYSGTKFFRFWPCRWGRGCLIIMGKESRFSPTLFWVMPSFIHQ